MATGLIECPEAFSLAEMLKDENADFSRLSQNRVYENFTFRANVIAYLKACVLYVANGYRWEPEIEDFIRWSERYDLYCKMRFFGDAIKKAETGGTGEQERTVEHPGIPARGVQLSAGVEALSVEHKMSAKGTMKMLNNWLYRGYIKVKEE